MEFNETNWKECLEALNFTEGKNESFGGMVVYDDKGIPQFDYDSEECENIFETELGLEPDYIPAFLFG